MCVWMYVHKQTHDNYKKMQYLFSKKARFSLARYFKPTKSGKMLCRDLWHELSGS